MRGAGLIALGLLACEPPPPRVLQADLPGDTRDAAGPYRVTLDIRGVTTRVTAVYAVGDADPQVARLRDDGAGRWGVDLPGQAPQSEVRLFIEVEGPGGDVRWPDAGEHLFRVLHASPICLVDGDCLPAEMCDRLRNTCKVQPEICADQGDCPLDYVCDAPSGLCRFRPSTCAGDAECGAGRVCDEGLCVARPECREDAECPEGSTCRVPPGRCVAEGCRGDGDCPDGRCVAGQCEAGCPAECPAGLECVDGRCQDVSACGGPCPGGGICLEGRCVECSADGHCGPEARCEDLACVPGRRGPACVPCGADRDCAAAQRCDADLGYLCLPACGPRGACPPGHFCEGEVCRSEAICGGFECRRDEDCGQGACLAGLCSGPQHCGRDADCAADWVCADGACRPRAAPCASPRGCPRGEICLGGRCQRGAPVGACAPCQTALDCGSPALCADVDGSGRRCIALCGVDGCPAGLECLEAGLFGVCLTPDATCRAPACGDDPYEPNDSPDRPHMLRPGTAELRVCPTDEDFLLIPELGGGELHFEVLGGVVQVAVIDLDSGRPVESGRLEAGEGFVLLEGSRMLRVWAGRDGESTYQVTLEAAPPPPCDDDFLEDNDLRADATILGSGADVNPTICAGDPDWFRLRLRPGEVGSVQIRPTSAIPGGLNWALEDGDRNPLGGGNIREGAADLRVEYRELLLLRVWCDGCAGARYNITTQFGDDGPPCPVDALEPNGADAPRALGVPFDRGDLAVCAEDEDWYRFTVLRGQRVRVELEFEHADGDIDVELFDEGGQPVDAATSGDDDERLDAPVRRRDAEYVLRVYLFPGPTRANTYRLRVRPR